MPDVATCPKCSCEMERGFIADQNLGNCEPNFWVAGPPEPSFWGRAKVMSKIKRVVETYRCVQCGLLESYAVTEWAGKVYTVCTVK